MPRTRPEISREQKAEEILDAAEARLRRGGYEQLSIAAIARELGLAQNAVYWYFASKDVLLVAVLERMLRRIADRKPRGSIATIDRVLWFTDQLADLWQLWGTIVERSHSSSVVADFVIGFDEVVERMLGNALHDATDADQLPLTVKTYRATIEGAFARGLDRRERHRILRFAFDRLTATA